MTSTAVLCNQICETSATGIFLNLENKIWVLKFYAENRIGQHFNLNMVSLIYFDFGGKWKCYGAMTSYQEVGMIFKKFYMIFEW